MPQMIVHPLQARAPGYHLSPRWLLVALALSGAIASGAMLLFATASPSALSLPPANYDTDSLASQMGWIRYLIGTAIGVGCIIALAMPYYPTFHWLRRDPAVIF